MTAISIPVDDRTYPAYLAKPDAPPLRRPGKRDVKVYPNSGHRFMSEASGAGAVLARILRLSYNAEDAADAWRRIYEFFDAELGGAESSRRASGTTEVSEADEAGPGQADS